MTMILILEEQLTAGSAFKKKSVAKNTDDLYRQYFEAYFECLFTYAYTIVKENTGMEETRMNLELLFNAVISNQDQVSKIFQK